MKTGEVVSIQEQYTLDVTGMVEYDPRCRDWCRMPYIDHPRGCTNYGKYDRCPPKVDLIQNAIDLNKQMWFLINQFDLEFHRKRMKDANTNWSDRQANCVLYWQGRQRKFLREYSEEFVENGRGLIYDMCPEAKGVNCFKILRKLGVKIVARPTKTVYMVSLVGYPISRKNLFDGW